MSPLKICLQVSKIQKKLHQRNLAKLRQESLDRHQGHRLRQTQRKNRQLNQLDNLSRINLKPNLKLPKLSPSARMTFRKKHLRQSRSRVSPSYGSPKSKKTKNNSKKPHPSSKSMSQLSSELLVISKKSRVKAARSKTHILKASKRYHKLTTSRSCLSRNLGRSNLNWIDIWRPKPGQATSS